MRNLFCFLSLLVWIQVTNSWSQYGPGGVGSSTTNRLWLRAGDITGLSDGASVSSWPDTSGNNNDASQATPANKPIYKTNRINGKPAIKFTGNTFLDPGALGIAGTGSFTYFVVIKDSA
jgi:hypothetical protein